MSWVRLLAVSFVFVGVASTIESDVTATNALASSDPTGEFFAVSCTGASYCLAVGTAAASWNGQSWTRLPAPAKPAGTVQEFMNAVSCPAVNNCVVVGTYESATTRKTLADNWNGHKWTPLGVGATTHADFDAVSCPTLTWCIAGGGLYSVAGGKLTGTVTGTWNGTGEAGWTVTPLPHVTGPSATVTALTCASVTLCVATGGAVDVWNGQSWSNVPTSPYDVFNASCQPGDTAAQCQYLGLFASGGKYYSDTLQNNGSMWQLVGATSGSSQITGNASAYSCASATSCFAVGQRSMHATGNVVTFTEHWNGVVWKQVGSTSPNPKHHGLQYDAFFGVSCVSATNCTAVGRANDDLLAEHWNGAHWQVGSFT